jgi:hypothetical protein
MAVARAPLTRRAAASDAQRRPPAAERAAARRSEIRLPADGGASRAIATLAEARLTDNTSAYRKRNRIPLLPPRLDPPFQRDRAAQGQLTGDNRRTTAR